MAPPLKKLSIPEWYRSQLQNKQVSQVTIIQARQLAMSVNCDQIVIIARNTKQSIINRTTWGADKVLCKDASWAAEIFEILMQSSSAEDFLQKAMKKKRPT